MKSVIFFKCLNYTFVALAQRELLRVTWMNKIILYLQSWAKVLTHLSKQTLSIGVLQ